MRARADIPLEAPFSLPRFLLTVALSLGGALGALALLAPATWRAQLAAGPWVIAGTFLAIHLANAMVEYVFHRYVLHASLIPFLRYFHKRHALHHGLTRVTRTRASTSSPTGGWRIENRYPIVEDHQHQASFFPWYTFTVFAALATPLFALGQWLVPGAPFFLAGYAAIAWSLCLYELFHAFAHLPLARWEPLLRHPRWGPWWRKVYGFHLHHHAVVGSNETISGFFGAPVADLLFGTYVGSTELYRDGAATHESPFTTPSPRLLGWLDRLAARGKGLRGPDRALVREATVGFPSSSGSADSPS